MEEDIDVFFMGVIFIIIVAGFSIFMTLMATSPSTEDYNAFCKSKNGTYYTINKNENTCLVNGEIKKIINKHFDWELQK